MTATERNPARRRRWVSLLPWAISAALAIACSILGYRVSSLNDAMDDESRLVSNLAVKASHAQQVLEVLNAPDAQRATLTANRIPPGPTAHVIYVADRSALVMEASHLQPIPGDKTYQLWILPATGSAPISGGTFRPNGEGYASMILPHLSSGIPAKGFEATVEKAGGATAPTTPIVLAGE